jgi:hypothetical protein
MLKRFALALLAPIALAGCTPASDVPPPIQPRQDVYRPDDRAQIYFDSTDLRNDTAADTPSVYRDAAGLLHVSVHLRSVVNRQLYVEYRAIFFDSDHREIDRSPWQDKVLPANLPDSVAITSTTPRAQSFQVQFRYSNSTQNPKPASPAY